MTSIASLLFSLVDGIMTTVGNLIATVVAWSLRLVKETYKWIFAVGTGVLGADSASPDVDPPPDYTASIESVRAQLEAVNESVLLLTESVRAVLDSRSPHDDPDGNHPF